MKIKDSLKGLAILLFVVSLSLNLTGCGSTGGMSTDEDGGDSTTSVTGGTPASISIEIPVETLPADGISSTTITASVADRAGQNVPAGTPVTFTINDNGITGSKFPNGEKQITLTTPTDDGTVVTSIIAGTEPGQASVVVSTSNNITQTEPITFTLEGVGVPGSLASITLTPMGLETDECLEPDGFSSVTIEIALTDSSNESAPSGTMVYLNTTRGEFPTGGQTTSVLTNADGKAYVSLRSTLGENGRALIYATSSGVSQSTTVCFGEPGDTLPAAAISLTSDKNTILPMGSESFAELTATVTDEYGNPIEDGERVTFQIKQGGGSFYDDKTDPNINRTTENGVAKVTYYSSTSEGTVIVQAQPASNNGVQGEVAIELIPGSIALNALTKELVADGSSTSEIKAVVTDSLGNFVEDGTSVTFTVTQGTGIFGTSGDNTIKVSTVGGTASVTYIAGQQEGEVVISASGTGLGLTTESLTLLKQVIGSIELVPLHGSVQAGGYSTQITATVLDNAGNPVAPGTPVIFSATGGTLALGEQTGQSITTETKSEGRVQITFESGSNSGQGVITAEAGSVQQKLAIEITGTAEQKPSITLSGLAEINADGKTSYNYMATVYDESGETVQGGTIVTFSTSDGDVKFQNSSPKTDGDGSATAIVLPMTVTASKYVTITASALGVSNDILVKVNFAYSSGPPDEANTRITASPSTLVKGETTESTIAVTVLDADGNPVDDGTIVVFSSYNSGECDNTSCDVTSCGMISPITAETEAGIATTAYTAPNNEGDYSVKATIIAADGSRITKCADQLITVKGPVISGLTLQSNRTSIPINKAGTSVSEMKYAVLTATPSLAGGEDAPDGTIVKFTLAPENGEFENGTSSQEVETFSGIAELKLFSGSSAGTVTVTAESGGAISEIEITYTLGSIELTAVPNTILADGNQKSSIVAVVKDETGNLVNDEDILFSLNDVRFGSLEPRSAETENGQAETTFYGSDTGGTAVITAEWDGNFVSETVEVSISLAPAFIEVPSQLEDESPNPNPTTIQIKGTGGQSTSIIVFDVKDINGDPVADGYRIDFEILTGPNGGEEVSPIFAETSNGQVSTILRSGYKSGPVNIRATYHNDTNVSTSTGQITISAGQPVGEEFGISAMYRNITGLTVFGLEDIITANVGDIYGNAVPDNTAISFKTYNTGGIISYNFDPNAEDDATPTIGSSLTKGGFASVLLESSSSPKPMQGFVSLTAEAVNGGRTTHITTLAVVPETENRQILYAGTDGGGVYKSTDSGFTWNNISRSSTIAGQNWIDPYINDIAVDPDNYNTVYAATGYLGKGNIFRSLDGGLNWNSNNVEEIFGLFQSDVAVSAVLCDDNGSDFVWIGTDGYGVYYSVDGAIFKTAETGLVYGSYVNDIVKVPGTNGEGAVLYAGTAVGVYRSSDGGKNWERTSGNFQGSYITKLALFPTESTRGNDIIYVGTEEFGVWVSSDGGTSWTNYQGGIGKGLRVSMPQPNRSNKGTGMITDTSVEGMFNTQSETWTVTYVEAGEPENKNVDYFTVSGTVSGPQSAVYSMASVLNGEYYLINNIMKFKIEEGTTPFSGGDVFTFNTVRETGRNIKDIIVDPKNFRLYAATYFFDDLEPHPVGSVYVHDLNVDGTMALGDWREANSGLPQYDPPDDRTLFAQHALAMDNPSNPRALFVGGEGINFYKATTGVALGEPAWQASKNGLTNLVMARMPILFSGEVNMTIYRIYPNSDYSDLYYINAEGEERLVRDDITDFSVLAEMGYMGDGTLIGWSQYTRGYIVYVQDENGNPPVSGSIAERASSINITFDGDNVVFVEYADVLTYRGTWRDLSDKRTNIPYVAVRNLNPIEDQSFLFYYRSHCMLQEDPNQDGVMIYTMPGCSGGEQTVEIPFLATE